MSDQIVNLTPEQRTELERQTAEAANAASRAAWLEQENLRREAENASLKHEQAVKEGLSSAFHQIGLTPHNTEAVLTLIRHAPGIVIRPGDDGPEVEIDGHAATLLDAAQRYAHLNPTHFRDDTPTAHNADDDDPTLDLKSRALRDLARRQGQGQPVTQILARSDFRSLEHKTNFIRKHGLKAFEALPATRAEIVGDRDPRRLTRSEYLGLNLRERTKIAHDLGSGAISRIMQRQ
jgi:hypothetical protein